MLSERDFRAGAFSKIYGEGGWGNLSSSGDGSTLQNADLYVEFICRLLHDNSSI